MTIKDEKTFFKVFIIIFLVSFLVINWSQVSWVFSYRFISEALSDFFQKEDRIKEIMAKEDETKEGRVAADNKRVSIDNKNNLKDSKKGDFLSILEIPKIEISAPLIMGRSFDKRELEKDLKRGVVIYPDSALPGQVGRTIILGHSAPDNWPKINYDWVFNDLNQLDKGDKIIVYFNNQKYVYLVKEKGILKKGEDGPPNTLEDSDNILALVSCWPPGKDLKRIIVWAKLVKK